MSLDPVTAGIDLVTAIVGAAWPNKTAEEQAQLATQLAANTNLTQLLTQQGKVDEAEAQSTSLFVSGWRPWIGWGCGTLVMIYVLAVIVVNMCVSFGHASAPIPPLDPMVAQIIFGLLGLNIGGHAFESVTRIKTKSAEKINSQGS